MPTVSVCISDRNSGYLSGIATVNGLTKASFMRQKEGVIFWQTTRLTLWVAQKIRR